MLFWKVPLLGADPGILYAFHETWIERHASFSAVGNVGEQITILQVFRDPGEDLVHPTCVLGPERDPPVLRDKLCSMPTNCRFSRAIPSAIV